MSPRTLQRWLAAEREGKSFPLGRPAYGRELCRTVRRAVLAAMRVLRGFASWRAVWRMLEGAAPISLVKRFACEAKRRWRAMRGAFVRARRQHVHVEQGCVLGSLDSTYLGRDEEGRKVWARHLSDVATRESLVAEVGGEPSGHEIVDMLEEVRVQRGLPLVLALDNGGAEKSEVLAGYLQGQAVVQLFNVPHTPQHNPWVERAHSELKRGLGINKSDPVVKQGLDAWCTDVEDVLALMNEHLPRPCLDGKTSAEARQLRPRMYDRNLRARFYAAACAAKTRALEGLTGLRAMHRTRRLAEREAVWETMEAFELITRARGDADRSTEKHDIIL